VIVLHTGSNDAARGDRLRAPSKARTGAALAAALLALGAGAGCSPPRPAPQQDLSDREVREESARALAAAREARRELPAHPEAAAAALDRALASLECVHYFHLPVVEARDRAFNAARHLARGEKRQALEEVEEIEAVLHEAARGGGPPVSRALARPLDLAAHAARSLEAGSPAAAGNLDALARELNLLEIHSDLAVPEGR